MKSVGFSLAALLAGLVVMAGCTSDATEPDDGTSGDQAVRVAKCKGFLPQNCQVCSDGHTECAHWAVEKGVCKVEVCPAPPSLAPAPGSFKLYLTANATPNPLCDVHRRLVLGPGGHATLREELEGACEIAVVPNERTYDLEGHTDSCGSSIFTATAKANGVSRTIKITDHRTRGCEDIVPAKIIVEESKNDASIKLFSLDR